MRFYKKFIFSRRGGVRGEVEVGDNGDQQVKDTHLVARSLEGVKEALADRKTTPNRRTSASWTVKNSPPK